MFFAHYSWYWTILPNVMFLTSFSMYMVHQPILFTFITFFLALSLLLVIRLCAPGITLWSTISINLAIPYWAISIALSVLITACIVI